MSPDPSRWFVASPFNAHPPLDIWPWLCHSHRFCYRRKLCLSCLPCYPGFIEIIQCQGHMNCISQPNVSTPLGLLSLTLHTLKKYWVANACEPYIHINKSKKKNRVTDWNYACCHRNSLSSERKSGHKCINWNTAKADLCAEITGTCTFCSKNAHRRISFTWQRILIIMETISLFN